MILVIDVGNSNIVIGIYQQEELLHHWRVGTNRSGTVDEYGMLLLQLFQHGQTTAAEIEGVIISSVVPPLRPTLEGVCQKYLKLTPWIVGPGIKTGLNIRYENPKEVGADRIVNAVAAIELYGSPLIIVDFGTATTYEYINEAGQYIGGLITPGIGISTEALYQKAAKLPRIDLEMTPPPSVVGRNPVTSMQAGIIYGFAGQVDGIVERIRQETRTEAKVVATGGFSEYIASQSKSIEIVDPLLTLKGLRSIYAMNN